MGKSQWQISNRFIILLVIAFGIPLLAALFLFSLAGGPHPARKAKCLLQLRDIEMAIKKYQATFTNYPAGNCSEIVASLLGDNLQKIRFIDINTADLNSAGEYLDPWTTPYVIIYSPANNFIISSAGPNKIFDDEDDIVFNSVSNDFVKP